MINTNQTMAPPELNAQFNNLIYLHGQNTTIPILRHFKPYFTMRHAVYNYRPPLSKKPDISGVNYYFDYHDNRLGDTHSHYQFSETLLLRTCNKTTKQNEHAIKKVLETNGIRDFINTPGFSFRVVNCAYKMSGKKYFIHLAVNTINSRLNDSKKTASNYYINPQLTLLETIK